MDVRMEFTSLHALTDDEIESCGGGLRAILESARNSNAQLPAVEELSRVLWREVLAAEIDRRRSSKEAQARFLTIDDIQISNLEIASTLEFTRLLTTHLVQLNQFPAAAFFAEVNRAFSYALDTANLEKLAALPDNRMRIN